MEIEWDEKKARLNRAKHGVSFEEASELFKGEVDYLEIYDEEHSEEEDRFTAIGPIKQGMVVVVFAELADDVIRLISARPATVRETNLFWRHAEKDHE